MSVAGRAKGTMVLSDAMNEGHDLGSSIALELGYKSADLKAASTPAVAYNVVANWGVESGKNRAWVDFQNEVTAKDVR